MDAKSLAKSKRAHSQHHKKHHPNQKAKGTTSSAGSSSSDKASGKAIKEKPRQSQGPAALPSNWDRYEDEYESNTENQIGSQPSQPSDIVLPKSKGADYAYLISEAKSQDSLSTSLDIFSSFDDFVNDFDQGRGSFFSVQGESILSSIQNDCFVVEDKATTSYEASFLSLDLHALAEQLAKVDLRKRLFVEDDLLPPEVFSEVQESHSPGHDKPSPGNRATDSDRNESQTYKPSSEEKSGDMAPFSTTTSRQQAAQPTLTSVSNPSEFKAQTAEAELDILLDSFTDAKITDSKGSEEKKMSISLATPAKKSMVTVDIDDTLDDLLKETSAPSLDVSAAPTHPVSKSKLLDDFDSWLDSI